MNWVIGLAIWLVIWFSICMVAIEKDIALFKFTNFLLAFCPIIHLYTFVRYIVWDTLIKFLIKSIKEITKFSDIDKEFREKFEN